MEQHPVPSQISSYQFRLVGDMTLKQFLQLAGGVVVGLIIYATGLPGIIKWPLIIIFVLFGAALAFLPFQDRPLEEWVLAFFRSIYQPTLYVWQQGAANKQYFKPEPQGAEGQVAEPEPIESIEPVKHKGFLGKFEEAEQAFLQKVGQLTAASVGTKPSVAPASANASTVPVATAAVSNAGQETITTPGVQMIGVGGQMQQASPLTPTANQSQEATQAGQGVSVPETGVIRVNTQNGQGPGGQAYVAEVASKQGEVYNVDQILSGQASIAAQQARFSQHAAPPEPPTQPNTIVGQVVDSGGRIVEGAILEVKDQSGRPVRALKTNKAGHFMVVTPLLPGKYQILTEKEGYTFDPVEFVVENKIIGPIAIAARKNETA